MSEQTSPPSVEKIKKLIRAYGSAMVRCDEDCGERLEAAFAAVRQLAARVEELEKNDEITADYIQATHDKIHRIEAERDAEIERLKTTLKASA